MKRDHGWILTLIWVMVVVGVAATTITLMISNANSGSHFVTDEQMKILDRYARLEAVHSTLVKDYYQPVDEDALMLGAIRGMMASLGDPYTFYYTPEELAEHDRSTTGEYYGVGLLLQNNANAEIEIIRVYADSPAERGGARVGDIVKTINGVAASGKNAQTLSEAANRMRGKEGEILKLTVLREGKELNLEMEHAEVLVSNISCTLMDGDVGYIGIFQFSGDDVDAFREALRNLPEKGARSLIIDVRNNPGGLLDDVTAIADMLLPEVCVVYTENRDGRRTDYYSDADCCDLPLCVLVNGMSASASEILAAAIQDTERGTIVGTQTYGKGIVQSLLTFESDEAGMQYTSERYFTPSGKCIHGVGVTPDVIVEGDLPRSIYEGVPNPSDDPQLSEALKILRGA